MLHDGVYTVQTWNGKDGYLTNEKDELVALTKSDLPVEFNGRLVVGEKVEFVIVQSLRLIDRNVTEDERERRAHFAPKPVMSARAHELMNKEIDRRTRYGSGPGVMGR
jgi:hypothetical protein